MRPLVVGLILLVFAPLARSQQPSGGHLSYEAMIKAPVGAWAEYSVAVKGQTDATVMRFALVEKTAKHMALEIESKTPSGPLLVRLVFQPSGPAAWKVIRALVQVASAKPEEVPPDQLGSAKLTKDDAPGDLVGKESVKTPAGTFVCRHVRQKAEQGSVYDMWLSDQVLPSGMVKATDSRGAAVTLSSTGSGATPKLK